MSIPIIDAHIHLDMYCRSDREKILNELDIYNIEALIAVSNNFQSAQHILEIASSESSVKPAFGFHPEQELPCESEVEQLIQFIRDHHKEIYAIGEIGLPYYLKKDQLIASQEPYIELLTLFIKLAKELNKPVALHAIYDDAPIVCDLLESYSIKRAHFHWFKGDEKTIDRMIDNCYHISVTPDVLYEKRAENLVNAYPLELIMLETDGPWSFERPFENKMTHPKMIHQSIEVISKIKGLSYDDVASVIYETTKDFYGLSK